jgi:hypothetical protein
MLQVGFLCYTNGKRSLSMAAHNQYSFHAQQFNRNFTELFIVTTSIERAFAVANGFITETYNR